MTQVQLVDVSVTNVMEVLYALRDTDYVQDKDYWFTYHKGEYEMYDVNVRGQNLQFAGARKDPNRVVFTFVDDTVATWFVLRFGGTVVSDDNTIDDN